MIYTRFSKLLRAGFAISAILLTGLIIVKSLSPAIPALHITNIDKIVHILAYLVLGFFALPAMAKTGPLYVWALLSALGVSLEILQSIINTGRTADIMDALANAFGAFLAIIVWRVISRLLNKNPPETAGL